MPAPGCHMQSWAACLYRAGVCLTQGCAHGLRLLGHLGHSIWLALHNLACRGGAQPVADQAIVWQVCPVSANQERLVSASPTSTVAGSSTLPGVFPGLQPGRALWLCMAIFIHLIWTVLSMPASAGICILRRGEQDAYNHPHLSNMVPCRCYRYLGFAEGMHDHS